MFNGPSYHAQGATSNPAESTEEVNYGDDLSMGFPKGGPHTASHGIMQCRMKRVTLKEDE